MLVTLELCGLGAPGAGNYAGNAEMDLECGGRVPVDC